MRGGPWHSFAISGDTTMTHSVRFFSSRRRSRTYGGVRGTDHEFVGSFPARRGIPDHAGWLRVRSDARHGVRDANASRWRRHHRLALVRSHSDRPGQHCDATHRERHFGRNGSDNRQRYGRHVFRRSHHRGHDVGHHHPDREWQADLSNRWVGYSLHESDHYLRRQGADVRVTPRSRHLRRVGDSEARDHARWNHEELHDRIATR